ncbi:pilin [Candidatus Minimicrobia naudis]|uniref:Pilin n=1 Tax=Candidatus Minimicrobia naudis TaxID=2841263 RepID=A0A8F1SBR7_9BACT|nr:pilin [Candidatus Minimicrobia naudis]
MKKSIISIAIMTCAVFGASVLSTASLPGSASAQVSEGINTATTSEMKGKSIDGDNGLIKTVVNVLLWAVGILSVIMIIFSGFRYITSAGDASKTKSAQNALTYSVVGLIVAILAYAIVNMVTNRL